PARTQRIYPPTKITSLSELWSGKDLNTGDLSKQIYWSTRFLLQHRSLIAGFLSHLECFETAVISGRYHDALDTLNSIEAECGVSIWLIDARIALLHRYKGLESQKAYAASVHEAAPRTVPAYVAYYASQRNEDSTAFDRYAARVSDDI